MKNVNEQIKALNFEFRKKQNELKAKLQRLSVEYARKTKALTKGYILCDRNDNGTKYNPKTNKISDASGRYGCKAIYIPKKDFYFVEVEDYDTRNVGWDTGYGDYDTFAIFHTITKYKVCPKCGRCRFISEKILEQSHSWSRCDRHDDYPKDFIPEDWKKKIRPIYI